MILQLDQISKSYNKKKILNQVSFSISQSEIVGLIGPNGSGKTTLLNIIMGMLQPSSGSITFSSQLRVGMSVSRKGFFDDMSVVNNILIYSRLLNINEKVVEDTMKKLMIDFHNIQYGKLSAGMKQKVSLLLPFISQNDLIFLDEPTNHLDIDAILNLRSTVLEKKESGVSFLITSHILSDLEKVCDRIIFLKSGRITVNLSTTELVNNYGSLEKAYINFP